MNRTLLNLALTAALLAVTASGVYSKNFPAGPSQSKELMTPAATDSAAVKDLLDEALNQGKDAKSRCAAITSLGASRNETVLLALAGAVMDADTGVRVCASRMAGETKNAQSVNFLLTNVRSYLNSSGSDKNAVNARLAAINSIWSLGEIGNSAVLTDLVKFYKASDDTLKINNLISMGKLTGNADAAPFIKGVAASPRETEAVRAAAFEMLEELGQSASITDLAPSLSAGIADGDILFAGGLTGDITSWVSPDLPVGHAGIFAGAEIKNGRIYVKIGDCVPNFFTPGGVRNVSAWKNFTHLFKYPYYGNRTSKPAPTPAQRNKIVELSIEMGEKGLHYDITHISQKGPVEFDCVGYSEYIYEAVGLNPTDNSYETGLGWPLTPWEQFAGTVPSTTPAPSHAGAIPFRITAEPPLAAIETLKKGLFGEAAKLLEAPAMITPAKAD